MSLHAGHVPVRSVPPWDLGVRARLLLAFFGITAFAVLAAAVGIYAFRQVGERLDVVNTRVPPALASLELSRSAERIIAAAPALLAAADRKRRDEVKVQLESEVDTLTSKLRELQTDRTEVPPLGKIEPIVTSLTDNLAALEDIVARRLEMNDRIRSLVRGVFQTNDAMQRLLAPWLMVMESQISRLVDAARGSAPSGGDDDRAGRLASLVVTQRPAQNVEKHFSAAVDMLAEASTTDQERRLAVLAFQLGRTLRDLEGTAPGLDPKLRPLFLEQVAKLKEFTEGPNAITEARKQELALIVEGERRLAENAALTAQLTTAVDDLSAVAQGDIRDATRDALSVQRLSTRVLIGAVALSLLTSILIVWLYVGRSIVRRLTMLSSGMLAIAGGELDAGPAPEGSDEIAAMGRAVEVFRRNAIDLQGLLEERKQAAARLEETVDVRTRELSASLEQQTAGYRTLLGVPLLREGIPIGALTLGRRTVRPFTGKEIGLVKTFADQAVIAIENVRLFEEVQERTRQLSDALEQQTARAGELQALGEVVRAVNSTLELETVLSTIVAKAVQLSDTDAGAIYVYSNLREKFRLRATYGMSAEFIEAMRSQTIRLGETAIGEAVARREPLQIPDLRKETKVPVHDLVIKAGYRGLLIVPLLRPNQVVGALVVRRREPGAFPRSTVDLLMTFAEQSVLAIQNARLFSEIEEKGAQLQMASRHKSQFLANMSHELRTPLNSVLGFTEMMADGLYGDLPARAKSALTKVQANGTHLLGLINDVLDLAKIEAGQLTLSLGDYAIKQVVHSVVSGTEALARAKGISVAAAVADGLPLGYGDERRITQVLLNLVGNALKFTDAGSVKIDVSALNGFFEIEVCDTGPGIAPDQQGRIFEEFQQVDDSSTRKKGGTGLGLAISKRIVELHGGTIGVASVLGVGSTFRIVLPVRSAELREAA